MIKEQCINIIRADITDADVDAIVCASNGKGYMGGWIGKLFKCRGVAETIHYKTQGKVEKQCYNIITANGRNFYSGETYVTQSYGLPCKYVIHAITMDTPAGRCDARTVTRLMPNIIKSCQDFDIKTVAIPLLGCGAGKLDKDIVLAIYREFFSKVEGLTVQVYDI